MCKKDKALISVLHYLCNKQLIEEKVAEILVSAKKRYPKRILISGTAVTVCFGWEEKVYKFLHKHRVLFLFASGKERGETYQSLGSFGWNPDFIIGNDIVEVKGAKPALQKFNKKQLPAFRSSEYAKQYNLYLCGKRAMKNLKNCSNYAEFLQQCRLVSSATK